MTCYVDALVSYPDAGFRYTEFCHLLADDRAELHRMADQLGIPRRFFQDHPWRWHYDLPAHVRADAVGLGAQEVSMRTVGALLRARRRAAADHRAAEDAAADHPAADDAAAEDAAADPHRAS